MTTQSELSCFVSKLQYYVELTDTEKESVSSLEKSERQLCRDEHVYREGDHTAELFIVKRGWLCTYRYTDNGQRQIVQLRHPGDLCGMHDIMLARRDSALMALEDSVVCPLPKKALIKLMGEAPKVAMLIQAMSSLDHVVLVDLMQAIARTSASDRVLHLLLLLLHRLRLTNSEMKNTFRLPMTQSLIGDLIGLTNVTVSKAMTELEREGFIERSRGMINFLQSERAADRIGYTNRFDDVDVTWL